MQVDIFLANVASKRPNLLRRYEGSSKNVATAYSLDFAIIL